MACSLEITGLRKLALYLNKDVSFDYPDNSVLDEIDFIDSPAKPVIISDLISYPKWKREINNSGNYIQSYEDTFVFFVHGIQNRVPAIIKQLRESRVGYIAEAITTGNKSLVFQAPVFVSKIYEKDIDSHSWTIEMSYREPTFLNYLKKLNTTIYEYAEIDLGLGFGLSADNDDIISPNY